MRGTDVANAVAAPARWRPWKKTYATTATTISTAISPRVNTCH